MHWKRKNNDVQPVWRGKDGSVKCPGEEKCPGNCDNSCPIWLNTRGLECLMMNQQQSAIDYLTRAIQIAPDFPDAHNNLGSVYGSINKHREALECFREALKLRKDYPNAWRGLIIAEKNLGRYSVALEHYDEYVHTTGYMSKPLREEIISLMEREKADPKNSSGDNWLLDASKLLDEGRSKGFISSSSFLQIPELLVQAENVCSRILQGNRDYLKEHPEDRIDFRVPLVWSALAGVGSTYLWNSNWESLSKKGIYESLTEERGYFAMDEYVLDTIGIPFDSKEAHDFMDFLFSLSIIAVAKYIDQLLDEEKYIQSAKSMFAFGSAFEMERLGLK